MSSTPPKPSRPLWPRLVWGLLVLALLATALWWRNRPPEVVGYRIATHPLIQNVVATGYVITPSRVQVASEITGTVIKRLVDRGAQVKAGQPLLELRGDQSSAQLDQARAALRQLIEQSRPQAAAALAQAKVQVEQAERDLKRAEGVFNAGGGSAQQLEQAQTSLRNAQQARDSAQAAFSAVAPGGAQQRALEAALQAASAVNARNVVRAGVAGVVLSRNVEVGDTVTPGQALFTLAMDGATEILLPVNEQSIGHLQLGQPARCVADAYPDRSFEAQVSFLAPQVDRTTGTLEVRLRVANPPAWLRQDMTVSADIVTARLKDALVVPNEALRQIDGHRAKVLVARNGRAELQAVETGLQGLTLTQITSGLTAGETVLSGTDVTAGSRVRVNLLPLPTTAASATTASNELPMPGR